MKSYQIALMSVSAANLKYLHRSLKSLRFAKHRKYIQ